MDKKIKIILLATILSVITIGIVVPVVLIDNKKENVSSKSSKTKDVQAIKSVLDGKSRDDLIINLASNKTENIIGNSDNKAEIEKQLRILAGANDGLANNPILKGVSIIVSMEADAPLSTTPQTIIVTLTKDGISKRTSAQFQVRKT